MWVTTAGVHWFDFLRLVQLDMPKQLQFLRATIEARKITDVERQKIMEFFVLLCNNPRFSTLEPRPWTVPVFTVMESVPWWPLHTRHPDASPGWGPKADPQPALDLLRDNSLSIPKWEIRLDFFTSLTSCLERCMVALARTSTSHGFLAPFMHAAPLNSGAMP